MKRTAVLAAALLAALGLSTAPAGAHPGDVQVQIDLAKVRAATAQYHYLPNALDAGYIPVGDCVPGMGYHYLNPALAGPGLDPEQPELLVYAPTPSGGRRLVAVEYFQVDADGDLATDSDRPSLFGVGFDGPMPGHEPGMPVHYDLHAWVWKHNPDGMFAAFNPNVTC
ncbi:hypothetical protein [Saccharothrix variisporea]|uniref:Secreted protein n=1 Tax=Saccharothrix variisporea TaxID=543527 RepID=A0A495X5W2_9PSEU|nr:hypothetical protein [Saccharothrix variisporea]RKT69731.1 hypothetical protein DFJ66_2969 [Saccharothrix variisporea]